ncbi:hypothetical protein CsatA_026364 [Cannabis sativa]
MISEYLRGLNLCKWLRRLTRDEEEASPITNRVCLRIRWVWFVDAFGSSV